MVPKTVVREDHQLEKTTEQAGNALAQLRWHWTMDEQNPQRVPVREYARAVSRNESTVRRYANAHLVRQAAAARGDDPRGSREIPFNEALEKAGMSAETAAATEAVARARGLSVGHTRKEHPVEIRKVRETARQRAEDRGTTVEEEATRAAEWAVKSEDARRRERERRGADYVRLEGHLVDAKKPLTRALALARDVDLDGEEQELVESTLNNLRAMIGLINTALSGESGVDWDAELAALGI